VCGIFGAIDANQRPENDLLRRSLRRIGHRGPDGEGLWERETAAPPFVALGHRRLAIIDLTDAGAQPMAGAGGRLWLTYNGEIYNYLELMDELRGRGHVFQSHSDSEVILKAYEEWGVECLQHFNGMFAFAIWDEGRKELFAARDRFGEKPFHYCWLPERNWFAFGSEVKSLLLWPEVDAGLDERALYRFLAFRELAAAEQTLWRGVRRLPHAHYLRLRWTGGRFDLTLKKYWDIDLKQQSDISLTEAARRLRELFADSIRLRLRADVPVGSSLSGGLDSSAVVCQIHALGAAGGQKTFSARMEDATLDEGKHIRAVLQQTGIEGHEVWPSVNELEAGFARLCYHLEEPFLSTSQFAQHLVMRLARDNGVTVLLDGQGADEILAGYSPYFLARYAEMADHRQLFSLWREWRGFRQRHARRFPLTAKGLMVRAWPFLRRGGASNGGAANFQWPAMREWWSEDWLREFRCEEPPALPDAPRDTLTRRLYSDALGGHLQELLRYGDRNSMAWSREVRQPFLDHRIAELLFALPPEYKLAQGETKVVMRRAFKDLIPASITMRQDKLGYQAPMQGWLGGPARDWAAQKIADLPRVFGERLAARPQERFQRLDSFGEDAAWAVFTLLTAYETQQQLRAVHG
jgi:asparagine synthase (glutamine-hydrolysing)